MARSAPGRPRYAQGLRPSASPTWRSVRNRHGRWSEEDSNPRSPVRGLRLSKRAADRFDTPGCYGGTSRISGKKIFGARRAHRYRPLFYPFNQATDVMGASTWAYGERSARTMHVQRMARYDAKARWRVKCALLRFEWTRRIFLARWRRCANGSIAIDTSRLGSHVIRTEIRSLSPLSSLTSGRARRSQAISTTKGRSGPAFRELSPLPCRGNAVSRFG